MLLLLLPLHLVLRGFQLFACLALRAVADRGSLAGLEAGEQGRPANGGKGGFREKGEREGTDYAKFIWLRLVLNKHHI